MLGWAAPRRRWSTPPKARARVAIGTWQRERVTVEPYTWIQRSAVAGHHAIERLDRQLAVRAVVVDDLHAVADEPSPGSCVAAVGEDPFVEQQHRAHRTLHSRHASRARAGSRRRVRTQACRSSA